MKRLFNLIFPALYGLLVYATVRLLQDTESGFRFWQRAWQQNAIEISLSIGIGYASVFIINRLCRASGKYAVEQYTPAVLLHELLILAGLHLCLVNVSFTPLAAVSDDGLSWSDLAFINVVPLLYAIIYYGILRSRTYLNAYVRSRLLLEKITNDQLVTELQFLKSQFHPHFLFNALNTIYFQMDDDISGAKQSVETLSELLRYQLYSQQQQVPIRQELEYLKKYIALQKTRASHRLSLTVAFDDQLTLQLVYPLLFLPLVENAFKYVGGLYNIKIEAGNQENGILFRVSNSLPEHPLPVATDGGIGLHNLQRRLTLLYPGNHMLTVDKQPDCFTAELYINNTYDAANQLPDYR